VPVTRRIRFLYAQLLILLGTLLLMAVMDWVFVTYFLIAYLATLAVVELVVSPVWRIQWNRRVYFVLFAGLFVFLGFAGELILG